MDRGTYRGLGLVGGFTRGMVGFAVGGLNRAEEMVVVEALGWIKKESADRFTTPYTRGTNTKIQVKDVRERQEHQANK